MLDKQHLKNSVDRRQQIKQAALSIFARRGYAGTKTNMIASDAGISEGLIYRYFKSKEELYSELVQELMEEAIKELEHIDLLPGTPLDQVMILTKGMLEERNKDAFMLILRAKKEEQIPEIAKQILEQHSDNLLIDRLVPIFVKGQQLGEFSQGDPRELLSWYFYVINSLIMQEVDEEKYGVPDVDFLIRFLTK